jgi:hypothetical protein
LAPIHSHPLWSPNRSFRVSSSKTRVLFAGSRQDQLVIDLIKPFEYLIYFRGRSIEPGGSLPPLRWGFFEIFSSGARTRAGMAVPLVCLGIDRLWAHPFSSLTLVTAAAVRNPSLGSLRTAHQFWSARSSYDPHLTSHSALRECWSYGRLPSWQGWAYNTSCFCSVPNCANNSLNQVPTHLGSTLSQNPSLNPSHPL